MKDYVIAAQAIDEFIDLATPESVDIICKKLDEFWKSYCEVDVTVLWLVRFTRHNHAAKGTWASLDYKLRAKLKQWKKI